MAEVETAQLAAFLAIVAASAYLQTLTGFALALGVLGAATQLEIAPIATTAIVVSLLSLANGLVGLYGQHRLIQWRLVGLLAIGMYPAITTGVLLLQTLGSESVLQLQRLLGGFILIGGIVTLAQRATRRRPARRTASMLAGLVGGLFGGLFSVITPPLVHHLYREPVSIEAIRATLFAAILVGIGMRMSVVLSTTEIDTTAVTLAGWSMPVVLVASLLARHYTPTLTDRLQRRLAIALLTLLGAPLLFG